MLREVYAIESAVSVNRQGMPVIELIDAAEEHYTKKHGEERSHEYELECV